MKARDAVSLIEAAYRVDLTTEQWLEGIASSACTALGSKQGAMAFRYDASSAGWVHSGVPVLYELSPEFARVFFDQRDAPPEVGAAMANVFRSVKFGSIREVAARVQLNAVSGILDRFGIEDMVGVNGLDPSMRGCMLAIADDKRVRPAHVVQLWHRLAAHVSAGNRLRLTLETLAKKDDDLASRADAVLAPSGRVEHATGAAETRGAREALRQALVRIDSARSERDDARRSVELWRGLVSGRWSLVEHFERDGRRYFLAHKNDPNLAEDRALTRRERQVLGYAELGYSNKFITYALGLSPSSVSTFLQRARKKLGRNRSPSQ